MQRDTQMSFRKMNGLGNEIVVLDARRHPFVLTAEAAARIAANERTRFDQLMVLYDADRADVDARVEIFNRDGSRAGACGNGMRCVARTVFEETGRGQQRYETAAGTLMVTVADTDTITVDMGRPGLRSEDIPTRDPFYDTTKIELQIGPIDDPILHSPSICSMGNPHAVFWVADIGAYDLGRIGPLLEHHPMFLEGANITLASVESPTRARIRTWERGAGLTKACGTAACATLVSAVRKDLMERSGEIIVPGGPLHIEWAADDHVLMTGPAELEHEGQITFHAGGGISIT
ncbi:MAG: diaminopimelate epimerase [Alphaproteobacteria bacterium]|nr:diaminopimelate epimerase [Alphaproteobacteria bacterium]